MHQISVGKTQKLGGGLQLQHGYYYLTLSTRGKSHMHILLCTRNVYDISKRTGKRFIHLSMS